MSAYPDLTRELNAGRKRAVVAGDAALVLHRLTLAGKDGAWILAEGADDLRAVLEVLARHGARYRFGAPLDVRWMVGGWSSHLEFSDGGLRIRTDFFTRPPRVSPEALERMWQRAETEDPPITDAHILAEMKKTSREKDYPFIAELARRMPDPRDRLRYSRSADDLIELANAFPDLVHELATERTLLRRVGASRRELAEAIQLEMLDLVEADRPRLEAYRAASTAWAAAWPVLERELADMSLPRAHEILIERARDLLPTEVHP